jgi:hypothetical protein
VVVFSETTADRMTSADTTDKPFMIGNGECTKRTKRSNPTQGAAGVDGQTIEPFEADMKGNL